MAALALNASEPAVADTDSFIQPDQTPYEQVVEDNESQAEAIERIRTKVLPEAMVFLEERIDFLNKMNLSSVEERVQLLDNMRDNAANPEYLDGLVWLDQQGVDLDLIVTRVDPGVITDRSFLTERINAIPEEIRFHIRIAAEEFALESERYDASMYRDPDFQAVATTLSEYGTHWMSYHITKLIEAGKNDPKYLASLGYLAEHGVEISSYAVIDGLSQAEAADQTFLHALTVLSEQGIDVTRLLGDDAEGSGLTREQARDPNYIEALTLLHGAGVELSHWVIENLSAEKAASEEYMGVMLQLLRFSNGQFLSSFLGCDLDTCAKPGASAITELFTKYDENPLFMLDYGLSDEKIASAEFRDALDTAYSKGVRVGPYRIDDLTLGRINDPQYVELLLETMDRGREASPSMADSLLLEQHFGSRKAAFDSIPQYMETMNDATGALGEILREQQDLVYLYAVIRMNENHNESDAVRMAEYHGLSAAEMFGVIVTAGPDAYDSSFKLLLDGRGGEEARHSLYGKIETEFSGDILTFIEGQSAGNSDLEFFLEQLSQHGKLTDFFDRVGDEARQLQLVEYLYLGLESAPDKLAQATAMVDALDSFSDNPVLYDAILDGIASELTQLSELKAIDELSEDQKDTLLLYKLSITNHALRAQKEIPWAAEYVAEYGKFMPTQESLSAEELFTEIEGKPTHVQRHFFYDDREGHEEKFWDGHHSLKHYLSSKQIGVAWDEEGSITDISPRSNSDWTVDFRPESGMAILTDESANARLVVVLNLPDNEEMGIAATGGYLETIDDGEPLEPHTIVHRGHSYHVDKTISEISAGSAVVDLGSCGGYRNLTSIMERNPNMHVISTKGTGMMGVNDLIKRHYDQALVAGEEINWAELGQSIGEDAQVLMEKYDDSYTRRIMDGWQSYVMPDQNSTVQLVAAYNQLKSQAK